MFKAKQRLGKYRIERKLAEGGFAVVYRALDTIEGIRVALKVPHEHLMSKEAIEDFRREVRLAARLDHLNILPLKSATFIDRHFVIAFALGEKSLEDRLQSRLSLKTALSYAEQMMEAVAYAHQNRILHCDIKPENMILFPGERLRLTDFGIAKVAFKTISASGAGTLGYIAPEQAMGKPSLRSDVFSLGMILYRLFAGKLPSWPLTRPLPGYDMLKKRVHPDFTKLILRAIEIDPRKRFRDASQMLAAFKRVKPRALQGKTRTLNARNRRPGKSRDHNWELVRRRQFKKAYGQALETHYHCARCEGPVSEAMVACPWCGVERARVSDETRFPAECRRCHRGMKLDWSYCAWCHGPGFDPLSSREYSDRRYEARCANPGCSRRDLMPFMRYCPWCRRKVRKRWKVPHTNETCKGCGWGVYGSFWSHCPWCGKTLSKSRSR